MRNLALLTTPLKLRWRARRLQPKLYAALATVGLLALASIWLGILRPIEQLQGLLAGG